VTDTINCKNLFSTINFYIGAQRIVLGNCSTSFVWTPSTNVQIPMKYSRWEANQPDCYSYDTHKNESCASYQVLKKTTAFNDLPCDMPHCSICQWVVSGNNSLFILIYIFIPAPTCWNVCGQWVLFHIQYMQYNYFPLNDSHSFI